MIGIDGKVLIIKHQESILRVASCRVLPKEEDYSSDKDEDVCEIDEQPVVHHASERQAYAAKNPVTSVSTKGGEDMIELGTTGNPATEGADNAMGADIADEDNLENPPLITQQPPPSEKVPAVRSKAVPKSGDIIRIKETDESDWSIAKVISRAGKQSGKNKFWVNVDVDGELKSVNLEGVDAWADIDDHIDEVLAVQVPKRLHGNEDVVQAKLKELDLLKEYKVYVEVPDQGQVRITTTWVITKKTKNDVDVIKARLVARGFEEETYYAKDSPTVSRDAFRVFLALTVAENWIIESTDVKSAFLQGQELDREVFVEPPVEAKASGKIWRMLKPLYGLRDAPRRWYLSVAEYLISLGFAQCKLDSSVFMFIDNNKQLNGLVLVHVDDFLHSGNDAFNESIIPSIRNKFTAGNVESQSFTYIGLEIEQMMDSAYLSQQEYVQKLKPATVSVARKVQRLEPLDRSECRQFRQIVGQINWAAQQTRPDT